jgi:predicted nucleic acid-binding protein
MMTLPRQPADLMTSRQRKGRPVELRDTMFASTVVARPSTLATRKLVHFEILSVPVVNPWLV